MLIKQFHNSLMAAKAAAPCGGSPGRQGAWFGWPDASGRQLQPEPGGKVVVVYYWASWNNQRTIGDFASLASMLKNYGSAGRC